MRWLAGIWFALVALTGAAQTAPLQPVARFPLREEGPVLRQHVAAGEPFTVAGPTGVLVGEQQGLLESWVLPVKLLSRLTLEASVQGYDVPLDMNGMAREIEVRPDRTTITYSHIAVTVRQIMFAPRQMPPGTGAVILFAVDAVRPVDLTLRFTGEMRNMWPQPGGGSPSAEWVERGASGLYLLHTDFDTLTGAIALPGAQAGIMAPYQERPQVHPLELHLHVDPAAAHGVFYPLLMAAGTTQATASPAALESALATLDQQMPALYARHAAAFAHSEAALTAIHTPDAALDEDFTWAETSIGQLRARATPSGETGLVAGYYASGDSARPGFGWYFGRDTLYTLYAIHSYGDFALARTALEFLIARERADGKVMHEYSQTAPYVDWKALPYWYAAADATPLFLTAMLDYVRASGDLAFLQSHKDAVLRAWSFESTHDADGDGIYDNRQGTGWVESWPPGMPLQEVYLALVDQQGSAAMGQLAALLDEPALASAATARATKLTGILEREYYLPKQGRYAFSRGNAAISGRAATQPAHLDTTDTSFPAIAWWNAGTGYAPGLEHAPPSLALWASHTFLTDWGARDVAEDDPLYDPISYHQGSVWPLFTGWVALAEYRGGNPLAGYQAVMQNADLTRAQDPGAVTELLSGAFFEPFGRSTSHQLWSSAMVVTPLMRGLFGILPDALHHAVSVTPNLPADWLSATVERVHVGDSVVTLDYRRTNGSMAITLTTLSGPTVTLSGASDGHTLTLPLPAVELALPHALPLPGSRTAQVKVLSRQYASHSLTLHLEGMAGTSTVFTVQRNQPVTPTASGAAIAGDRLTVAFPTGTGYVQHTVTLDW